MKGLTFWILSTVSAVVLLFGYHTSTSGALATSSGTSVVAGGNGVTPVTGSSTTSGSSDTSGSSGSSGSASTGSTSSSTSSGSASSAKKTVTGSVAQTRWGPVQVQLTVTSGKIADVSVVQYPNGNGRDQEINSYALPVLIKETLSSQSTQIDMVSGATVTSNGYLESLQSALDKTGL